MNRLTKRTADGFAYTDIPLNNGSILDESGQIRDCYIGLVADRLAAYEDTGLTPEEFTDLQSCLEDEGDVGGTIRDLIELMNYRKLEEQGLLIKLPCKVGDYVYEATTINGKIYSYKVEEISFSSKYGAVVLAIDSSNKIGKYRFKLDSVGKAVFLTREEAEKALKKEE